MSRLHSSPRILRPEKGGESIGKRVWERWRHHGKVFLVEQLNEACLLVRSINRSVGPSGPFFPSCLPGTLLNSATYAQALSQVATLKGEREHVDTGVTPMSGPS